jgi:hypothetical protein
LGLADGEYVEPAPDREHRVVLARRATKASPALWVGHTGDDQERDVAWYVDAVVEFIRKAADHPAEESRVRPLDDPRPVLGIPLVGTGAGGMRSRKGELVKQMVRALVGVLGEVQLTWWSWRATRRPTQRSSRLGPASGAPPGTRSASERW